MDTDMHVDVRPLHSRLQKVGIQIWTFDACCSSFLGFGNGG